MKNLIFVLSIIFLLPSLSIAQEDNLYDELQIVRASGKRIVVQVPYGKKLITDDNWKALIIAFREDLRKVEASLPNYDFYEIEYTKGSTLEFNEVIGKEVYSLGNEEDYEISRSNYCHLRDKDIYIKIQFTDYEELYNEVIESEIEKGITENEAFIKSKSLKSKYYYKSNSGRSELRNRRGFGLVFATGFNVGLLRGSVNYELRAGLGLGMKSRGMIGINSARMFRYDRESNRQTTADLLGFYIYTKRGGIDFMWKLKDEDRIMGDYNFRMSLKYKYKFAILSIDGYGLFKDNSHLAFSLGVGF